ncbi:hypothetical protein KJ845_04065, partial [Patescibacteria group bacterium]|nr:hypothetical protein [Patescibacteria group bacterium]
RHSGDESARTPESILDAFEDSLTRMTTSVTPPARLNAKLLAGSEPRHRAGVVEGSLSKT